MSAIGFDQTVPILRVFSVDKAKEFYVDYLGFTLDWEHRFADDLPLYMQVSRGALACISASITAMPVRVRPCSCACAASRTCTGN
jgi:hypothetical protein